MKLDGPIGAFLAASTARQQFSSLKSLASALDSVTDDQAKGPLAALLEFVAQVALDTFFADLKAALHHPLLHLMAILRKLLPGFIGRLADRTRTFVSSFASDSTKAHIAVLKTVLETPELFADALSPRFSVLLQELVSLEEAHAAQFCSSENLNLTKTTVEAEISLKIFHAFSTTCAADFRRLALSLQQATAAKHELKHDQRLLKSELSALVRILTSKKCPVHCLQPAGIAFAALFCALGDPATVAQQVWLTFFASLSPSAAPVFLDALVALPAGVSFRQFVAELGPLPRVCLLRGLVIAGADTLLLHSTFPGQAAPRTLLLSEFFPTLCELCESTANSDQWTRSTVFQTLTIVCHKMREKMQAAAATPASSFEAALLISSEVFFEQVLRRILGLVLTFFEDTNDGVVMQVKALFVELLEIHTLDAVRAADADRQAAFTQELFARVVKLDWVQKAKLSGLQALLAHYGAYRLLSLCPDLLRELFLAMGSAVVRNPGGHLLDTFLQALRGQTVELERAALGAAPEIESVNRRCMEIFLPPLVEAMKQDDPGIRDGLITYALTPVLQNFPTSLRVLVLALCKHEPGQPLATTQLWGLLALLKSARQLGQLESEAFNDLLQGTGIDMAPLLENALTHNDEELRNIALEFVCISSKLTESPTKLELDMIQYFVVFGLKSASAGFRQRCVVRMKKFFLRLKESARRKHAKAKERDGVRQVCAYVAWIAQRLAAAFYPGAPFQRKVVPLEIYEGLVDIWGPNATEGTPPSSFLTPEETASLGLFSEAHTQLILGCVWDVFDRPRQLAFEILQKFPTPLPTVETPAALAPLLVWAVRLICSPRSRETDTGALVLRLVFQKYVRTLRWAPQLSSTQVKIADAAAPVSADPALAFVQQLLGILDEHIELATHNFAAASQRLPMHGVVLAIRYLLELMDFRGADLAPGTPHFTAWQRFVADLIERLHKIMKVALNVVGDIAPEGFKSSEKPSYHDDVEFEGGDEDEGDEMYSGNKGQILLVCSWVSVKEVGLLIGTLVNRLDLPEKDQPAASVRHSSSMWLEISSDLQTLLSFEQIKGFGDMLIHLLLSTIHNGAVEGANLGFTALCDVLLKSANPALFQLPRQWLEALLRRVELETLIITRRSSGLPPAFMAILRGEVSMDDRLATMFPYAMGELLRIARTPSPTSYRPTVHALHVMRSLIQGLAGAAGPFLADAFVVAIKGYKSENWSIRNSSTMMYSVILDKMVGPRRPGHDQASTTCEQFFARYPSLHPFLLQELSAAMASLPSDGREGSSNKEILYSSLYPVLVLFSRFLPAAEWRTARGQAAPPSDTQSRSEPFIEHIAACAQQSNFKVRDMAARALVPLVAPHAVAAFLSRLLDGCPATEGALRPGVANGLHGKLCQLRYLVQANTRSPIAADDLYRRVLPLLQSRLWFFAHIDSPSRFMLFEAMAALSAAPCGSDPVLQGKLKSLLLSIATKTLALPNFGGFFTPIYRKSMAKFSLAQVLCAEAAKGTPKPAVDDFLSRLLNDSDYEVRKRTLKILCDQVEDATALSTRFDAARLQRDLLKGLSTEKHLQCLSLTLRLLHRLALPLPADSGAIWDRLVAIVNQNASSAGLQAIIFMGFYLRDVTRKAASGQMTDLSALSKQLRFWQEIVQTHSRSSQSLDFRVAALESLVQADLPVLSPPKPGLPLVVEEAVIRSWLVLVALLQDDDDDVRREASSYVCHLAAHLQGAGVGAVRVAASMEVSKAVEFCFEMLAASFSSSDILLDLLLRLLSDATNAVIFEKEWDPSAELFEREGDNFWNEDLLLVQLASQHLRRILDTRYPAEQRRYVLSLRDRCLASLHAASSWLAASAQGKWAHAVSGPFTNRSEVFQPLALLLAFLPALAVPDPATASVTDRLATVAAALSAHPLQPLVLHMLSFVIDTYSRVSQRQVAVTPTRMGALSPFYLTSALGAP